MPENNTDLALTEEARLEFAAASLTGLAAAAAAWALSRSADSRPGTLVLGAIGAVFGGVVGTVVSESILDPGSARDR